MEPTKLSHRLTTQDASFIYGESQNGPLHIGSIAIFDREIDFDTMLHHIELRMHLLPRYRQRLAFVPFNVANASWEDDAAFDLSNHLFRHQLPPGCSVSAMVDEALKIYESPLDRKLPLWEMHLFNGLEGGRSAIMWKVHHCLVDGVSGMELLATTLDVTPDAVPPAPPETPWKPAPMPSAAQSLIGAAFDLVQSNLAAARRAVDRFIAPPAAGGYSTFLTAAEVMQRLARPIVAAPWNSLPVTKSRSMAWSRASFGDLRRIRAAFGGTINDVVLTTLGEAAARYLADHKASIDGRPLRIGCPVNVRSAAEDGALGNRVSMMFPELDSAPRDPVARLGSVIEETERIKNRMEPQALELLMQAADAIPPALMGPGSVAATTALDAAAWLAGRAPRLARMLTPAAAGINFIATNVPGAQVPLYLAGAKIVDYVGLLPLGATLGYGVSIVSYNQGLYFGMIAEPNVMPDVDLMKSHVDEVLRELIAAADHKLRAVVPVPAAAPIAQAA